jgi:hypothetical protein
VPHPAYPVQAFPEQFPRGGGGLYRELQEFVHLSRSPFAVPVKSNAAIFHKSLFDKALNNK